MPEATCQLPRPTAAALPAVRALSLRQQADRSAWELGALLRRIDREMPDMAPALRDAIAALQAVAARALPPLPGRPRQGELFERG